MENIYAALLLHKLEKEISEDSLKKVIEAAGGQADESRIKTLVATLKGIDIAKELENAAVMSVAAPSAGSSETSAKPAEEVKEETKTEAAAEGLSALFG